MRAPRTCFPGRTVRIAAQVVSSAGELLDLGDTVETGVVPPGRTVRIAAQVVSSAGELLDLGDTVGAQPPWR
jgi:hypothetical protein